MCTQFCVPPYLPAVRQDKVYLCFEMFAKPEQNRKASQQDLCRHPVVMDVRASNEDSKHHEQKRRRTGL